jgi:hypothetical protein
MLGLLLLLLLLLRDARCGVLLSDRSRVRHSQQAEQGSVVVQGDRVSSERL